MRSFFVAACSILAVGLAVGVQAACGGDNNDSTFNDGSSGGPDGGGTGCTGSFGCNATDGAPACRTPVECAQQEGQNCAGGPAPGTTISGVVTDPAGKVPLYNATVYIPLSATDPLDPIPDGATGCDRCDGKISGSPIAITTTDTSGHFTLKNAAFGDLVPLVIQLGKWRRQVSIPNVAKCTDTQADASLTRLPRNRTEGNIPRIALTTGGADPLQCLLRKVGLDDSEFGIAGSDARVHFYAGGGSVVNSVNKTASAAFSASHGGAAFPAAAPFWSDQNNLQKYDLVLMACEGDEDEANASYPNATKTDAAKTALYNYAKTGGRVFMTHYHEVWLRKSPVAEVSSIATWAVPEKTPPAYSPGPPPLDPATTAFPAYITGTFDKAKAMQDWLSKQNALTAANGGLPEFDARHNVDAVSSSGLSWITLQNPNASNTTAVQYMTFNTPVGADEASVCGRVMFSNLHVGSGLQGGLSDDPQAPFPDGCRTGDLSAQQKALEFMLFDLSSCIQKDDAPIVGPK